MGTKDYQENRIPEKGTCSLILTSYLGLTCLFKVASCYHVSIPFQHQQLKYCFLFTMSHQRQPIGKNSMNGKSEADPNNDVKPKNDLEEENAVKVKLPSCLSYEGKRHLKLAHNNSDV